MKRKLLAVLLVGLLAVLVTACKNDVSEAEKQSSEQDVASIQLIESQEAISSEQESDNNAEENKELESQEKPLTDVESKEEKPLKNEVVSTLESEAESKVEANKKPTEQKEESKPEKEENKVTYQVATPESPTESKTESKKDKVDSSSEKAGNDSASSSVQKVEKPQKPTASEARKELIGKTKAKEIALSDAKVDEKDVRDFEIELDREKKTTKYEIGFKANGFEYEYDIDAYSGKILFENSEKDDDFVKVPSKKPAVSEKPAISKPATNINTEKISKDKAKEIALSDAKAEEKDVRDFEIELDREKKTTKYEIGFKANGFEYEYDIDANTGKILFENSEKDDDFIKVPSKKPVISEESTQISKEKAKEIAFLDAGVNEENVREFEIEFDKENKFSVYEIEFKADKTEYKYEINAQNGKIIDKEIEKD